MAQDNRFVIITPMKNEGPFIVEWVAHHLAIGADEIVVFSNDCTDGSDALLDRLAEKGYVKHFDNTSEKPAPQRRAYRRFQKMKIATGRDWVIPIDADEYINIKVGKHQLSDLTDAIPEARTISMTWRLFGNAGVQQYSDKFLTDQFRMAAPEVIHAPAQAWGLKTMFQAELWRHMGVHRPKKPTVDTLEDAQWFNGSGQRMPERYWTRSWRSGSDSYGYDFVQLNHYALKSCESYLVKKARGRAHHGGEALGLEYWHKMNQNRVEERSIDAIRPRKARFFRKIMSDAKVAELHATCCDTHRKMIADLHQKPEFQDLVQALITEPEAEASTG